MEPLDLDEINAALDLAQGSTPEQRRLLHKLGKSTYWIKRFASSRQDAAVAIDLALKEREALEQFHKRKPPGRTSTEGLNFHPPII